MVLLSRLFPASRTAQNASRIPGRRRPKASPRATPTAARAPSLAAEPLERRAMLAVTASLVGGDLVITYNEAGDSLADISSDGTIYTVVGTGLAATKFNVADVTGVISVADKAAVFGQQFKVNAGTPLANALQVNANVESTSLLGGITTARPGDVSIGSAVISLASDISTAATSANIAFTGPVTLTNGVSVSTGAAAGNILFSNTIDGAQPLDLTAGTGNVTFTGAVGGGTRLGAISIASATNVLANAITAASLSQAAGSGTTSLNGGVNTNTATGVSLTGTNLAVNAGITTTNSGKVTFNQSGTAAIAVLGDISADGAVSVTAAGGITTAGDVTTTDDDVTFASKTTLTGPVAVSTGAAAGNILFTSTLDGAKTLDLTAGTGSITFTGAVGGGTPLAGISLMSAASVTSASTLSLDGTPALATDGITIAAGVNKVSLTKDGSTIQNFSANGIWFKGGSADSTIGGFTIEQNGGDGVRLDAGGYSGTTISKNSISGNDGNGVRLTAATGPVSIADNLQIDLNSLNGVYAENSTTVSIVGNSIVGNTFHGVSVGGGSGVIVGNDIEDNGGNGVILAGGYDVTDNLVELNDLNGIQVATGLTNLDITGNTITANDLDGILFDTGGVTGFDVSDNAIYQNTKNGILVGTGTYTGTVIGGGNEITLNTQNGIELAAGGATGLLITGNKIGTLADGTTDAGNVLDGIQVNAGGYAGTSITANSIAYNDADGIHLAANGSVIQNLWITANAIFSNDSDGIQADAGDYAGTVITTNTIRDNGNPTTHEGNGILVEGSNLMIGWVANAGQPNTVGNTITGNAANGIEIRGAGAQNNTILSNSIYFNGYVAGGATVVGEGIALTAGGNGGQAAPVILRAVDDGSSGVVRVLLTVPQDGDYYVQLFDNTPTDERGIFPADTNGFEGRIYVGDSPAQADSAVTNVKPAIAGVLLTGNQLELIEIPASRLPAGNWITATATRVIGTTPGGTSPFSAAVQRQDAPVLAVGTVGPGTWSQEFSYSLLSQNQLRVTGLSPGFTTVLAGLVNTPIVITPAQAAAAGNVSRTVVSGQLEAGGSVILNLAPGGSLLAGGGTLVIGAATLPAAQLYDTSNPSSPVFAVGPVRISSALDSAGVPAANANAFVNRYQGGLRVASADLDGDGFADLVTAPGAAPATMNATFGDAARVITIYNGDPAGVWQSASVNVGSVFGGTYTGGFLAALGDVHPDNAGSGSAVTELIVASTGRVAVFEVQVPARGAQPVINPVPVATWTSPATVTGIAAGDFSTDPQDLVVVATTTTNGNAPPSADMATATVRTFAVDGAALVPQQEFRITSEVQNGPAGALQNVFLNGATLAVGDIDGELTSEAGQPRLKPELVLASQAMGLGNFRVLANELVAGGSQAQIDTALTEGNGFTRQTRMQFDSNDVWQPAGGPDYFVGTTVPVPTAGGANAGLAVAVVDSDGRLDAGRDGGRAEVFASLNANATSDGKLVRKIYWGYTDLVDPTDRLWRGVDAFYTGQSTVVTENAGGDTLNAGAGPVSFTSTDNGTRFAGFFSLGRIMIEVSGLNSSLSGGSQAQLNLVTDPRFNSIQTIAAAGYPSFVLPSVYLGGVPGTPPVGLPGSAGIGTVTDPGGLYQAAAQNAFENNPILAATFGRQGTAIFDQASSGTLPSTTPGVQDAVLFYDYVVGASGPVLAVGSDGPAVWVPHYNYEALSGNVLRLGGLTVTEVNRLVAMRGRQIFISANGRSEVATATVANVRRIGGRAVNMVLRNITSPEGSLAGTAGRLEPGPLTLPTARLYDAATGEVVLDVGAEAIAASLQAAGVAPAAADAFVSRFQGGLRVASGDVDGDGFAELVTAPGAAPAIPAATFGNATRIITIYSGNPAAAWESASLDVTAAFPGYSGGFQVTLGDVLPDAAGDGSGVIELIVAGTNKVAVYELTIPEPGAAPEIAATPVAEWAIGPRFRITGLAAGDFSAAASDEVVVATAGPAGTVVRTFSVAAGSFAAQSTFRVRSYVEGDPRRRLRDVFANGAALAVGDIDGAADGKPELVLAAAAQGLANFRVLANDLVTGGTQRAIDTALAVGNGFTQQSRSQYAMVNGRRVWQPAGGPDYFAGMSRLTNAFALGINAPLSVAVVNATGATAAGQVFAALGPQNATSNMIRRLAWSSLDASWSGTDAFQAQPAGRTRFPLGGGLLLG